MKTMPATATIVDRATIDTLLSPFEHRAVTADRETILARRNGAALGHILNRIQGADYTDIDARLDRLWRNGQVTKQEYVDLVAEIARQGLFKTSSTPPHGR